MDAYGILRLRSGARLHHHEECSDYKCFHILRCPRYEQGQPQTKAHNDRIITEYVQWARANYCLAMGIPKSIPDVDGGRIIDGNPFDSSRLVD